VTKPLKGLQARTSNVATTEEFISARNVFLTQPVARVPEGNDANLSTRGSFLSDGVAARASDKVVLSEAPGVCGCGICAPSKGDGDGDGATAATESNVTHILPPSTIFDEGTLTVAVGGSVSGLIDVTGDVDTIEVTLVAGQTYLFSLTGTGGTPVTDTFLTVNAPGGALINEDDDGGVGTFSLITITAAVSGVYTILAESFSNPGDPGTGEWTLNVQQQGADEAPGVPPSAVVHTIGSTTYGFISASGDGDVYQVNLTAGMIYNFAVAAGADYETDWQAVPLGEVDTLIDIYDSAGVLLGTVDDVSFPDDISSALGFLPETDGIYYIRVRGYSGQTGGYTLVSTESDLGDESPLDSIDWMSADNVDFVDVLGVPTAYVYFGAAGETFGEDGESFGWNQFEMDQLMLALEEYEQILGVNYEVTTDLNQATFRLFTTTSEDFGAYFYPQDPAFGSAQGIGAFNVDSGGWNAPGQQALLQGGYSFAVILHEFGHAHGLAHPHDNGGGSDVMLGVTGATGSYGIFDLNQGVYTVMSYNDSWPTGPNGESPFTLATLGFGWSGSLSAFDIAMLQIRYGVHDYNTGDDTYVLQDVNAVGTYYDAIWDSGGTDEITYTGTRDAVIDLTAATLDYSPTGGGVVSFVDGIFGGYTIANGVTIENATSGDGDDVLIGNDAANVLTGNDGNDTFIGREGDDIFDGGDGTDTAVYFGNQADYTITAIVGGFTITDNNAADGDDGTDTLTGIRFVEFDDGTVNLEDEPGNQAPTLTGLNPTLVFDENTVNAAAQLIDGDVEFDDSDGNFDGGTITVSGALTEDVIAVRNEGTGVGEVGVSGANITYGGVVVGTFAGGTGGTTLTITLNAAATSVAVDQILENLTYANANQDPTLTRTLTINVTDSDGADLGGSVYTPGPYVEQTGGANPIGTLPTLGDGPVLAGVDADNDGDLDLVLGDQPGTLRYFQNNAGAYTELTAAANPFNGFTVGNSYSMPVAIDFDGDGDMDLAVGGSPGTVFALQNNGNGTFTNLVGAGINPFSGIDVGAFSDPAAMDYDNDGDSDLVLGGGGGTGSIPANNGALLVWQNTGGVFTQQIGAANPFTGIDVGNFASPTSGDVDGDGDVDLVVGNSAGAVQTYLNNGSGVFTLAVGAANPFNGVTIAGGYALPSLIDIDGDGDLDMSVRGYGPGPIRYFENTGSFAAGSPPTVEITVNSQNDAPSGANNSHTIPEDGSYQYTLADFGFTDVDADTLLEVVVTTLPTNGQLQLNGVAVTAGQVISAADITAGLLDFVPDTGESGTGYATWTFQVRDNGGTANGGVNTDPSANTMTINVTPDNTAPTLTGFGPSVTFLENTVNATPQILDGDVTFTDAEGNFNGGSLEVTGLLAEDFIGVNNEGTGAGQIGVSGLNVTYEGVIIGTITDAVGVFTVDLNSAATSEAVDALIENLTYSNNSDTPTPSRTLHINVTDADGLDLTLPGGFVEATGGNDPLAGLPTFGPGPNLAFVDVNDDGDLDVVVGDQDGTLRYFENNGAGYTEVTGASNPFDGFVGETLGGAVPSTYTAPAAMDVDGDGDLDLVVGNNYGFIATVQNDGNGAWTQLLDTANPFDGLRDPSFTDPTALDVDGDGDIDMVVGSSFGDLYSFLNDGSGNFTMFGVGDAENPFGTVSVGYFSSPAAGDVDGDGDLDLVVGESDGTLNTFINNGSGNFTAAVGAANPFNGIDVGSYSIPTLVDIDGDGDDDLVVGDSAGGDTRVFINNAAGTPSIVVNVTPESDIFPVELYDENDVLVDTYVTLQEAIDAASDGYRIFAAAGTYDEDIVVDVDVTIEGANAGLAGTDGTRGAETIVNGSVTITAAGVTIDGVNVTGDTASGGFHVGVIVSGNDFSLINSVLSGRDGNFIDDTVAVLAGGVTGLDIGFNLITGYLRGVYLTGATTEGSVHDNLFQGAALPNPGFEGMGNGINSETQLVIITNNTFAAIWAGVINVGPTGSDPANLADYILNNTFTDVGERPVQVYPTDDVHEIFGTDYNEAFSADIAVDEYGVTNASFTFHGMGGNDHIYGHTMGDFLFGDEGDDRIFASGGDDNMTGGSGNDLIEGGAGIDTANVSAAPAVFVDTILGWAVSSADGNDFLQNTEIVDHGTGRNLLVGASGFTGVQTAFNNAENGDNVRLSSGTWTGTYNYNNTGLTVIGGAGVINATFLSASAFGITVLGGGGNDNITTGTGNDLIHGGGGTNVLTGGTGNDTYYTDVATTTIVETSGGGTDVLYTSVSYVLGAAQVETLSASSHTSTTNINLTGNGNNNTIVGNAGNNVLHGGGGTDYLIGFAGNDTYYTDSASTQIFENAGGGTDTVYSSVSYALSSSAEIEVLSTSSHGATAAINLTGNQYNQAVYGNAGANVLDGKGGVDTLRGFGGADQFTFSSALGATNIDYIQDMAAGTDKIALDDAIFTAIGGLGALNANAFVTGTAALDGNDRIIYNAANGNLYYDADGNGAGAAVLFANLQNLAVLSATDFVVI